MKAFGLPSRDIIRLLRNRPQLFTPPFHYQKWLWFSYFNNYIPSPTWCNTLQGSQPWSFKELLQPSCCEATWRQYCVTHSPELANDSISCENTRTRESLLDHTKRLGARAACNTFSTPSSQHAMLNRALDEGIMGGLRKHWNGVNNLTWTSLRLLAPRLPEHTRVRDREPRVFLRSARVGL